MYIYNSFIFLSKINMKNFILFLLCFPSFVFSQVSDNFSDGDFAANPTWSGNDANFLVTAGALQSNGPNTTNSKIYLSTSNTLVSKTEWSFLMDLKFNPTSTTFARIYLVSDQPNLSAALNGYYVEVGQTNADFIRFGKQTGSILTTLITGSSSLGTGNIKARIKVTRDSIGTWRIFSDPLGGTNYVSEGNSVIDSTFKTSVNTGVYCEYSTASRYNLYYFDDFFVGPINVDLSPPHITNMTVPTDSTIDLTFNEALDPLFAENTANYFINQNIGNPSSATIVGAQFSTVHLVFANHFLATSLYELKATNITDLSGNIAAQQLKNFSRYIAKPLDILINEVMADPDPVIGLPNSEYIELYNKTDFPINLKKWTISISTSVKLFPDIVIDSKGYLILTNDLSAPSLSSFGPVSSFSNFSLTNTADLLTLSDSNNTIIHTVNFSIDWYQDNNKVDGGWACEQIDPLNPCGESSNWKASVDNKGGTPGTINSVFASNPDNSYPEMTRIGFINNKQIRIYFNEKLNPVSCLSSTMYKVDNGLGYPVSVSPIAPEFNMVDLTFSDSLKHNIIYHIILLDTLSDCVGNKIAAADTARFAIPEEVYPSQVLVNEVLYNPKTDGVEFVEIYNNSDRVYDLADFNLCNYDTLLGSVKDVVPVSTLSFLIFPSDYIVLTSNPEKIKLQYKVIYPTNFVKMDRWNTLTDAEDFVVLAKRNLHVIDKFKYTDKMQFSLLNTSDGVSLERINFNRPTDEISNWHSAAESVGFATPTYKNSQYSELQDNNTNVSLDPEIFSPDNDGIHDVLNINYKFDIPGYTANIVIYDERGRTIRSFAKNQLLGTSGVFTWDGINDDGKKSRVGIYIVYFEAFDLKGSVKHYKKTCVLASKLK